MNKRNNKAGIYYILNLVNNKRYIGYTKNTDKRWDKHKSPSIKTRIKMAESLQGRKLQKIYQVNIQVFI